MHNYLPDILKLVVDYIEWIVGGLWGLAAICAAYDVEGRYGWGMGLFILLVNAALMYLVI